MPDERKKEEKAEKKVEIRDLGAEDAERVKGQASGMMGKGEMLKLQQDAEKMNQLFNLL